jgi:hypothetical protein
MTQYGYHTKLEEILRLMAAKIKFQKLSFLKIFHNEKVVKKSNLFLRQNMVFFVRNFCYFQTFVYPLPHGDRPLSRRNIFRLKLKKKFVPIEIRNPELSV